MYRAISISEDLQIELNHLQETCQTNEYKNRIQFNEQYNLVSTLQNSEHLSSMFVGDTSCQYSSSEA